MFQDPGELDVVKLSALDGSFLVHLVHVVMAEPVAQGGQYLTKIVLVERAIICLVEASEGVPYNVFWICPLQPFAKQGEKHGEVDGTWSLVHHLVEVLFAYILS